MSSSSFRPRLPDSDPAIRDGLHRDLHFGPDQVDRNGQAYLLFPHDQMSLVLKHA